MSSGLLNWIKKRMDELQKELNRIQEIEPYWQKLEWLKIKQDNLDLFVKLLELKEKNES